MADDITIDYDYKISDEVMKRLVVPLCWQECGDFANGDIYKAASFFEYSNGVDTQNSNYGIGNFTSNSGGLKEFLRFLKRYYLTLYNKLEGFNNLRGHTFSSSWIRLATGKYKKEFTMAQVKFLWYYNGVGAIKMLKRAGHTIKLDGSRPEGFFALLILVHNHAPAYIVSSKPRRSYWNAFNKAMKKYPKAEDSMKCIEYLCDTCMSSAPKWMRDVYKGQNKTHCMAMTTPLKSIKNGEKDEPKKPVKQKPSTKVDKTLKKLDTPLWGIDISKWNYPVDFKKVKKAGVKFVIIRVGFTSLSDRNSLHVDPYFETFYEKAKDEGLPVGVYYYSRCNSSKTAKAEAKLILDTIKGKKFEYPIFLDVEDDKGTLGVTSTKTMTDALVTCLSTIKKAGYCAGLYCGTKTLQDEVYDKKPLKDYDYWIACWTKECYYKGEHTMWQFGGETNLLKSVKISGIGSDYADQNYCYVDYPSYMKNNGLNNYPKKEDDDPEEEKDPSKDTLYDKTYKGTVNAEKSLNVRNGGGTSYKKIGSIAKGNSVIIVGITTNELWYKIKYNGGYGYVAVKYIIDVIEDTEDDEIVPDKPEPTPVDTNIYEQTVKACDAPPIAFLGYNGTLADEVDYTGDNDQEITEATKYPSTVTYSFVDFSDDEEDEEELIKALLIKYPKKPVFVAKTNDTDYDTKLKKFIATTKNVFLIDTGFYGEITDADADAYYAKIKEIVGQTAVGWNKKKTTPSKSKYKGIRNPDTLTLLGTKVFPSYPDKDNVIFNQYYAGTHCNVYVGQGEDFPIPVTLGRIFDDKIYPHVATFLDAPIDSPVNILINRISPSSTLGGFNRSNETNRNLYLTSWDIIGCGITSTLSHEFQHLILYDRGVNTSSEGVWITEGMSMLIQEEFEQSIQAKRINPFISNKEVRLEKDFMHNWDNECYGVCYAFWRYIIMKSGQGNHIISKIINNSQYGDYRDVENLIIHPYINKNKSIDDLYKEFKDYIINPEQVTSIKITKVFDFLYGADEEVDPKELRTNNYYGFCYELEPKNLIAPNVLLTDFTENKYLNWNSDLFPDFGDYKVRARETMNDVSDTIPLVVLKDETNYDSSLIKDIDVELKGNGYEDFGKVSSLKYRLPKSCGKSFYSRFIFETIESVQFDQDVASYLEGDDSNMGQFVPRPCSKYEVIILYNPDTSKYKGRYYYGVVTKVKEGSYEDFRDSIVKKDTYSILKSYIDNAEKMTYRAKTTCVSYKDPANHMSKWVVPNSHVGDKGRYYIDCSTFAKLFLMGLPWNKSPYVKKTTNLERNKDYSWSFNYDEIPRTSADQAQWCVKQGYVLYGIDQEKFSNLEVGDLLFYDRDSTDNGNFMNVSHVAIVYKIENGVPYVAESTNKDGTQSVRVIKVADNTPDKILLFARIKKY